jgi:hypothetical protein
VNRTVPHCARINRTAVKISQSTIQETGKPTKLFQAEPDITIIPDIRGQHVDAKPKANANCTKCKWGERMKRRNRSHEETHTRDFPFIIIGDRFDTNVSNCTALRMAHFVIDGDNSPNGLIARGP